jgi:hypothetical protein
MRALIVAVAMTGLLSGAGFARQETSTGLRGAWKLTEMVTPDGQTRTSETGLLLFTERHYSSVQISGERPTTAPESLTDADKIKLFDTVIANTGTYDISGTTLTLHVQIAKIQAVIGRTSTSDFSVKGKTLVRTMTSDPAKGAKLTYERIE